MFCSPTFLTSEDLISKAKKKHHNTTLDNTSDKQGNMTCGTWRQKSMYSDGDCVTIEPVISVLCSGSCVTKREHGYPWVRQLLTGQRYRCRPDRTVKKNLLAVCQSNSQIRTIKLRIVESCKCVLTKKKKGRRKCKNKDRTKNQTDRKCRNKNKKRRQKHRKNKRKHRQRRKNENSSTLTNNDR